MEITKEQVALMKKALGKCMVINKKIEFFTQLTPEEVYEVFTILSADLLDYNIPHYRVVGIKYVNLLDSDSVLRAHRAFGISPIMLGLNAQKLIPLEMGGYGEGKGYIPVESQWVDERPKPYTKIYKILRTQEPIGQLAYHSNNMYLEGTDYWDTINTKSLQYQSLEVLDTIDVKVPYLVEDLEISNFYGTEESYLCTTTFFYKKDKGIRDYDENAKLFSYDSEVFPCRTVYDLTKVFAIKVPTGKNTNSLDLHYFCKNVNEDGLGQILREYAEGLGEDNDQDETDN